jgi:prevent-host-death family protein
MTAVMTPATLAVVAAPLPATFMYMSEMVGVAELRQNLSVYLRKIAAGERFIVTDRNRPVAMLGPVPNTESRLDQLIAEGRVKPPKRRGPLLPPLEIDLDGDPEPLSRALEEVRGYR